jgi:hypothetical protein
LFRPISSGPAAAAVKRYRGFVDGRRAGGAAGFVAVDFVAAAPLGVVAEWAVFLRAADARVVFGFAADARLFAGAFDREVAGAPEDTRVECLARGRTTFLGAASATDAAAKAISSAARITLRLRIMTLR